MIHNVGKASRFAWRLSRNLVCSTRWGERILFPRQSLACRFGRGDAEYAISVFLHHYGQLSAAGFTAADRILEVGPGRNAGTSLLIWALNYARSVKPVTVILWDVFPNMVVNGDTVMEAARGLLCSPSFEAVLERLPNDGISQILSMVARGELQPDIRYRVSPLTELIETGEANGMALVYSQAAIEHVWHVADFWRDIISATKAPGGWHSHRIDLADHGRRNTNYIEMLEWSPLSYWLTMCFVPGAINRWRASTHTGFVVQNGMTILSASRTTSAELPVPRSRLNPAFRCLDDLDLRTTAIDLVAVRAG